ncbi:Lysine-specific demethylase 8 [Irineochytrium annulatum]|nr:Lysine-specific demethylase 8 [Irineochytrium annulatum]
MQFITKARTIIETFLNSDAADTDKPLKKLISNVLVGISSAKSPLKAKALAAACIGRANDLIRSVPYKEVTHEHRAFHEISSILQAVALLHESGVPPTNVQLLPALKSLDMTLIVSGAPTHRDFVQQFIAALESLLPAAAPTLSLLSDIDVSSYSPTLLKHPLTPLKNPPGLIDFRAMMLQPFLIRTAPSVISHWPAMDERPWLDVNYLSRLMGHRWVPVEIGSRYTDVGWSQEVMRFEDFLKTFIFSPRGQSVVVENAGGGGDDPGRRKVGYLAQHDLFRQIPALAEDISIPDYCHMVDGPEVVPSAWFGPANTVSPLHTDPRMNMFAQVVGSKYVRLYAPEESANVYPFSDGGDSTLLENTSKVDVENPDLVSFPRFQHASFVDCVVGPGDLLFIPAYCNAKPILRGVGGIMCGLSA